MKIILSFAIVLSFSLTVFADVPVDGKLYPPIGRGIKTNEEKKPEEKKAEENGACGGVMLFTVGIFLLGRWLIKKNEFQMANPKKLPETLLN